MELCTTRRVTGHKNHGRQRVRTGENRGERSVIPTKFSVALTRLDEIFPGKKTEPEHCA